MSSEININNILDKYKIPFTLNDYIFGISNNQKSKVKQVQAIACIRIMHYLKEISLRSNEFKEKNITVLLKQYVYLTNESEVYKIIKNFDNTEHANEKQPSFYLVIGEKQSNVILQNLNIKEYKKLLDADLNGVLYFDLFNKINDILLVDADVIIEHFKLEYSDIIFDINQL